MNDENLGGQNNNQPSIPDTQNSPQPPQPQPAQPQISQPSTLAEPSLPQPEQSQIQQLPQSSPQPEQQQANQPLQSSSQPSHDTQYRPYISPDPLYESSETTVSNPSQEKPVNTNEKPALSDLELVDTNISAVPPVKRIKKPIVAIISILLAGLAAAIGIIFFVVTHPDNGTIIKTAVDSLRKAESVTISANFKPDLDKSTLEILKQIGLDIKSLDTNFSYTKQTLPTSGKINVNLRLNNDERDYNLSVDIIIDEQSNFYVKTPNLESLLPLVPKIKVKSIENLSKTDKDGLTGYAHLMKMIREIQGNWWKIPADQKTSSDSTNSPKELISKAHEQLKNLKISSAEISEKNNQIILSNPIDFSAQKPENVEISSSASIDKKTREFTNFDLSIKELKSNKKADIKAKIVISKSCKDVKKPADAKDFKRLVPAIFSIYLIINGSPSSSQTTQEFTEDTKCTSYQGTDPTDKCYRPGCKSAIEKQTDAKCIKGGKN